MIKLEQVVKHFGKLEVLKAINLHLQPAHCIALIGPNGCGKTTLIKSILGMVVPQSGGIYFRNQNIRNNVNYRNDIGYMPQIGRYPDQMTIRQIMDMLIDLRGKKEAKDMELYEAYGLNNMLDKRMRTLSGGTTQKVSAMLAFMFQPDVLILDEPTAGLDPVASDILKQKIIKEQQLGKLILITSHLLHELESLVDQVIYMEDGTVNVFSSVEELLIQSGEQNLTNAITKKLTKHHYE